MLSKRILFLTLFLFQLSPVYANDISVYSFNGLMDSNPISGDTLILENNLNSNETIGGNFLGLDINFIGNNHYIDGQNIFGGFVLNRTTNFDEMIMLDCRGQEYSNSYFAGALFNNGGTAMINTSVFNMYPLSDRQRLMRCSVTQGDMPDKRNIFCGTSLHCIRNDHAFHIIDFMSIFILAIGKGT